MAASAARLVLITGASAGIGRATALAFGQRGDRVLAVARSQERLAQLVNELGGAERAAAVPTDVTDADATASMARTVLRDFGLPDVVVANAGIGLDAQFTETTDEQLRAVMEVNLFGVVRTIRPFITPMVERGSGRLLLVSSVVGKRGIPFYTAYSASKFALHGLAEALRTELYDTGVTVGVICPSSTTSEFQERLLRSGPSQRRVRPMKHSAESVARAIVRMAGSRRRERVLSVEGKLLSLTNMIAPGFLDALLHRVLVRRRQRKQQPE